LFKRIQAGLRFGRFGKLPRRIIFSFGALALLSSVSMVLTVWFRGDDQRFDEIGVGLEENARTYLGALAAFMDECSAEVLEWSRRPAIQAASQGVSSAAYPLKELRSRCLPYTGVAIFSDRGRVLSSWGSVSDLLGQEIIQERWMRNTPSDQATLHWVESRGSLEPSHLVITAPVPGPGKTGERTNPYNRGHSLLAAVSGGAHLLRLLPLFDERKENERKITHWSLLDRKGRVLAASGNTAEWATLFERMGDQLRHTSEVHGHAIEVMGGEKWIVGFSSLGNEHALLPHWKLSWMRKASSVPSVVSKWIYHAIVLGTLLVLVALAWGWSLSGRIVRPILKLVDVSECIQRTGSLYPRSGEVEGHDEIGLLTRSFDGMIETLTRKTAALIRREREVREEHKTTTQLIVSGLAHQLNNPLSGIMDCVEELKSGSLDPDTSREYVALLSSGLDRIHKIVSRLSSLDLTAGEKNCITEVESAVRAVLGLRQVQIDRNSLRVDLTADAWIVVRADPSVFSDIVDNLLCNAIQASREGGSIRISVTQSDRNRVEMLVEDNGVGMGPDDVKHICEPFYSRRKGGVGLGMWTVQAYLDALGGTIEVDTRVGEGTTFHYVLPVPRSVP